MPEQIVNHADLSILNKDATRKPSGDGGTVIRLTSGTQEFSAGSAFSSFKINLEQDFSLNFAFRIKDSVRDGGDGMTFAVTADDPTGQVGGDGQALGYAAGITASGETYRNGISNSIAIEFDTFFNPSIGDPNNNHIGLNKNGVFGPTSSSKALPTFDSGDEFYSWIDYYSLTKRIDVFVSPANNKNTAVLGYQGKLDIPSTINSSEGYVGFTASSGSAVSAHDILDFQFRSFSTPTEPSIPGDGQANDLNEDKLTGYWKPKKIKLSSKKRVSAYILGDPSLEGVREINIKSIFADDDTLRDSTGTKVATNKKGKLLFKYKDFNRDGVEDLRLGFKARELQGHIEKGASELNIFGTYKDGSSFAMLSEPPTLPVII